MMDRIQRAHIFSSFDALKGFRELLKRQERVVVARKSLSEYDLEILDKKAHAIEKGMMLTVIYWDNGDYLKKTGIVSKISFDERYVQIVKDKIQFHQVIDFQAEQLECYEW